MSRDSFAILLSVWAICIRPAQVWRNGVTLHGNGATAQVLLTDMKLREPRHGPQLGGGGMGFTTASIAIGKNNVKD